MTSNYNYILRIILLYGYYMCSTAVKTSRPSPHSVFTENGSVRKDSICWLSWVWTVEFSIYVFNNLQRSLLII